jgi:hypothetical protein
MLRRALVHAPSVNTIAINNPAPNACACVRRDASHQ